MRYFADATGQKSVDVETYLATRIELHELTPDEVMIEKARKRMTGIRC